MKPKKMIELDKLNELLENYKKYGYERENFEDFIFKTTDNEIPVWKYVTETLKWTENLLEGYDEER